MAVCCRHWMEIGPFSVSLDCFNRLICIMYMEFVDRGCELYQFGKNFEEMKWNVWPCFCCLFSALSIKKISFVLCVHLAYGSIETNEAKWIFRRKIYCLKFRWQSISSLVNAHWKWTRVYWIYSSNLRFMQYTRKTVRTRFAPNVSNKWYLWWMWLFSLMSSLRRTFSP